MSSHTITQIVKITKCFVQYYNEKSLKNLYLRFVYLFTSILNTRLVSIDTSNTSIYKASLKIFLNLLYYE